MAFSYFTRSLAAFIIALAGWYLFFADGLPYWTAGGVLLLLLLLGWLAWKTVRELPPLDSLAFHRTLPAGTDHAFRQTFGMLLTVLAAAVVLIVGYGIRMNFSWGTICQASVMTLLVGSATWSFYAVAASLSSSREQAQVVPVLSVFLVPVLSSALIVLLVITLKLTGSSTRGTWLPAIVAAFVAYSFIWWLIAKKSRRSMGWGLGLLAGAVIPCYYFRGADLFELEPWWTRVELWAPPEGLVLVKKEQIEEKSENLILDDLFELKDLGKDHFFALTGAYSRQENSAYWEALSVRFLDSQYRQWDIDLLMGGVLWGASSDTGSTLWGPNAPYEVIRRKLPPGFELFASLDDELPMRDGVSPWDRESSSLYAPQVVIPPPGRYREAFFTRLKSLPLAAETYEFSFGEPYVFDSMKGGRARLKEQGVLLVTEVQSPSAGIHIDHYFDRGSDLPRQVPWVLAVDEAGKRAFCLNVARAWTSAPLLGEKQSWNAFVSPRRGLEILRRCKIYVYWPKLESVSDPRHLIPRSSDQ